MPEPPSTLDDDDAIHLVDDDGDPLEEIEEIEDADPTEMGPTLDPGLLEPLDDETTGALRAVMPPPSPHTRPPPPPARSARPLVSPSMLPPEPAPRDPVAEVEDCLSRLERIDDAELRGGLFRKLARILLDELEDPEQAFDVLVVAYGEDVEDDETGDMLERATDATGRWTTLVATANAWLSEPTVRAAPGKRVALMRRLAGWYGERLRRLRRSLPREAGLHVRAPLLSVRARRLPDP